MNKTDQAVSALLTMVRSGRFTEGDRLPTEPELVEELGVSRSAVREAVQSLSFAGVLHVRQGGGTFVTDLEPSRLLRSAGLALDLSGSDTLAELYAVRRILEPAATAMAVANLTDEDLVVLRGYLDTMREATAAEEFVQADISFHDMIAKIAGNETLRAILATLRTESGLGLIRRAREEDGAEAQTISEHEQILVALDARDVELARAATTVHLAKGQHWLDTAQD
ncbi:MAG TPA: FadR/GntR family transcriptional regulator [Microthrixaceae bacterium]|nr:FadR/GntR family transcriptional regulator [Microthrixaceae bacterium]